MNLKFQEVDWDNKELMYVAFDKNGETLRWYPKWADLGDIFHCALATEHGLNKAKLTPYLLFLCLSSLTHTLLLDSDGDSVFKFARLAREIEEELLNR